MTNSLIEDSYTHKPIEKLLDIRLVGSLSGCYSLASRAAPPPAPQLDDEGNCSGRVFGCRVQAISTKEAVLAAPVRGEIGERVIVKVDQFPILTGRVSRVFEGGFALEFTVNDKERTEIAAKIDWIKKNRFRAVRDKRLNKRIMPPSPQSAITLSNGTVSECLVMDVSKSGVAVSADHQPKIGERLAVGQAVGTVVRLIEGGFAMTMDVPLDLANLEPIFEWSLSYISPDNKRVLEVHQADDGVAASQ